MADRTDQYLDAYLEDLAAQRGGHARSTAFLSPMEQKRAEHIAKKHGLCCHFDGGYPDAERKMACYCPQGTEPEFPYTVLQLQLRNPNGQMGHRDVLGSVMGAGLKRETLGDAVCVDSRTAVIFLEDKLVPYLMAQLDRIGNEACDISYYEGEFQPDRSHLFQEHNLILASERLDCFVAALTRLAREKSVALMRAGKVFLNEKETNDAARKVKSGDVLVIRGYGKFRIGDTTGTTQKGRLRVQVQQYK